MGLNGFFVRDGEKRVEAVKADSSNSSEKAAPVKVREKEQNKSDLIDALLNGKEIVTEIDTPYGVFEFRYPSGADQLRIAHRRAAYLGGFPDTAFDAVRRLQFEQWATLDVLVSKKPERFEKIASWADCPIAEIVDTLYERGARFCGDIRERIRSPGPGRTDAGGESRNP
jgi:hypothetical protein